MARLIDSDKFLQDMADLYRQAGWDEREVHFSLADLRSNIGMEDVIPIPLRHGKWIEYPTADGMNQCSECGVLRFGESNYCPNCGARMDAERKEK